MNRSCKAWRRSVGTLLLSLAAAAPLSASDEENDAPPVIPLRTVIDRALENNFGLRISRSAVDLSHEDIEIERAAFDPNLRLGASTQERVSAGAGDELEGAAQPQSETSDASVSLSKAFTSGGSVTATTNLDRFSSNSQFRLLDPEFNAITQLDLRQPLLQGFGKKINLAPLARARAGHRASMLAVRRDISDLITQAEVDYWSLAYNQQEKQLRLTSLELAESLLKETRERERVGLATRLEVLNAEASLAARREAIILAEQAIEDSRDRVRVRMGTLGDFGPGIAARPLAEPAIPPRDFAEFHAAVLAWDPGLRIQETSIEQREWDLLLARNQRKAQVDLFARGGYLGLNDEGPEALRDALDGAGYIWRVGVEVSVPWGFRAQKARLQQARIEVTRERLRREQLEQQLLQQSRVAWREVEAARQRLTVTELSLELNEKQFSGERVRYGAGGATFREVLESQEDLDNARMARLAALRDLAHAVAQLRRLDGTVLEVYGFSWESVEEDPEARYDLSEPGASLPTPSLR